MPGGIESTLSYIKQNAVIAHAPSHENGGSDEVNVAALSGELADPQPPKTHAPDHQNGGGDEVNVADLSGELADGQKVKLNYVDKTHLSADFGASAGRLQNLVITPINGEMLRIMNLGQSVFSADINGNPTATSVVYDGDSNENMLNGLVAGATYWGRIILHNTTRGTSRKITYIDVATNTITTESSIDSWADNDVITCQSQTNTQAGYFDIDLSDQVASTDTSVFVFMTLKDQESNYDANRFVILHSYEAYDAGKRQWVLANLADEQNAAIFPVKVITQRITAYFGSGCVDCLLTLAVKARTENADT